MSGLSHHFMPALNTIPINGLRSQFTAGAMQNTMGMGMQNPLNSPLGSQMQMPMQLPNQMSSQFNPQMVSPMPPLMGTQMNTAIPGTSQMMGPISQPYIMGSPIISHQPPNQMQMQQSPLGPFHHHMMQQTPLLQQPPNVVPTAPVQPQMQQSKEFNTASLCRIGQETVQDIVSRSQEAFQTLKSIQPPNGTPQGISISLEKKAKVQELLRTIRVLFKRLRLIYEKCNENCQMQGMEYTHVESLIPFKNEMDPKHDEKKNSESYRLVCEESREVMEQVVQKNRQLKEIIDHLRRIIWEINTMLTMRRS